MKVILNGSPHEFPESVRTVADMLQSLGLADKFVAVEVNLVLVPKADHATCVLADGDRVEAVTFVGGG